MCFLDYLGNILWQTSHIIATILHIHMWLLTSTTTICICNIFLALFTTQKVIPTRNINADVHTITPLVSVSEFTCNDPLKRNVQAQPKSPHINSFLKVFHNLDPHLRPVPSLVLLWRSWQEVVYILLHIQSIKTYSYQFLDLTCIFLSHFIKALSSVRLRQWTVLWLGKIEFKWNVWM